MKDLNVAKLSSSAKELMRFLGKHRFLLIFLIASCAVMFALLQTRTYLNPSRDEDVYTELKTGVNYSEIDNDVVEKLQSTQDDEDIQVDANFVPNRSNPFSE